MAKKLTDEEKQRRAAAMLEATQRDNAKRAEKGLAPLPAPALPGDEPEPEPPVAAAAATPEFTPLVEDQSATFMRAPAASLSEEEWFKSRVLGEATPEVAGQQGHANVGHERAREAENDQGEVASFRPPVPTASLPYHEQPIGKQTVDGMPPEVIAKMIEEDEGHRKLTGRHPDRYVAEPPADLEPRSLPLDRFVERELAQDEAAWIAAEEAQAERLTAKVESGDIIREQRKHEAKPDRDAPPVPSAVQTRIVVRDAQLHRLVTHHDKLAALVGYAAELDVTLDATERAIDAAGGTIKDILALRRAKIDPIEKDRADVQAEIAATLARIHETETALVRAVGDTAEAMRSSKAAKAVRLAQEIAEAMHGIEIKLGKLHAAIAAYDPQAQLAFIDFGTAIGWGLWDRGICDPLGAYVQPSIVQGSEPDREAMPGFIQGRVGDAGQDGNQRRSIDTARRHWSIVPGGPNALSDWLEKRPAVSLQAWKEHVASAAYRKARRKYDQDRAEAATK